MNRFLDDTVGTSTSRLSESRGWRKSAGKGSTWTSKEKREGDDTAGDCGGPRLWAGWVILGDPFSVERNPPT
jgi:hypothetical protein